MTYWIHPANQVQLNHYTQCQHDVPRLVTFCAPCWISRDCSYEYGTLIWIWNDTEVRPVVLHLTSSLIDMHLKQTHAKKHAHTQTHTEMHTCTHTETHTIWADISLSNVPFVLCPSLIFHREISGVSILHENVEVWRRPFNSLPFYFLRKCNYQNYWSSAGLAHLTCEIEILCSASLSRSLSLSLWFCLSQSLVISCWAGSENTEEPHYYDHACHPCKTNTLFIHRTRQCQLHIHLCY